MLKGYKTFLVAFAAVTYALYGGFIGQFDWNHAMEIILGALGLAALRHGLSKD